jgi:hypothetical protein
MFRHIINEEKQMFLSGMTPLVTPPPPLYQKKSCHFAFSRLQGQEDVCQRRKGQSTFMLQPPASSRAAMSIADAVQPMKED